jgi:Secretion system C-terminal sorting domain
MKLKHLLLILFNITFGLLHAQSLTWYENIGTRSQYGKSNYISIVKIESDSQFVYVLATCSRMPIQFKQNKVTLAGLDYIGDAFIAQYTHNGHLNWVQKLGIDDIGGGYRKHIMALHKGNIYVSGAFYDAGLIGKDTIRSPHSNFYLAKINQNGHKVWHKTASSTFFLKDYEPKKIVFDPQDNIYLAGESPDGRSLIFEDLSTAAGSKQFIYKFDPLGKPLLVHSFKEHYLGTYGLHIADLKLDKDNNLLLLMSDGDRYTAATCLSGLALTRLYRIPPQGKVDTLVTIQNHTLAVGRTLSIAENGDIYIAGRYSSQLDINGFKSPTNSCDNKHSFLARVAPNGHLLWLKTGNSTEVSDIFKVIPEKDGNLLVMGIQYYEKGRSNNRFRYSGYANPYPNGETRCFIKRVNPFGLAIDSVEFYTNLEEPNDRTMMDFTQSPQGNLFFGLDYTCKLDTFSHTLCRESDWNPRDSTFEVLGTKLFVAQLSPSMLQKRQLSLPLVENKYQISPNPTSDRIYIQSSTPIPAQTIARLYDINGRLIQEVMYDDKKLFMEMNIANQPSGMYFLVLRSAETFISSTKIIKIN